MAVTAHFLGPSALDTEFLPSSLGIDLSQGAFKTLQQRQLKGRVLIFDGSQIGKRIGPAAPGERYVLQGQNIRPAMQQFSCLAGNRCRRLMFCLLGKGRLEKPGIDIVKTAARKTRLADTAFLHDFERQQEDCLCALSAANDEQRAFLGLRPDGAPAETLMQGIERVALHPLPIGADGGSVIDEIDHQTVGTPPLALHGARRFALADCDRPLSRHPLSPVVSVGLYR